VVSICLLMYLQLDPLTSLDRHYILRTAAREARLLLSYNDSYVISVFHGSLPWPLGGRCR
jgi:hypothetical protein